MSLLKTNQADVVSHNDQGWYLSLVVEEGEWTLPNVRWLLQEKLNAYAIYAMDGPMVQQHPDSAGKPVTVYLSPVEPIPESLKDFVDQLIEAFASEGLAVELRPLSTAKAAAA